MKKIAYIFLLAALFSCQTIPSADSPGLSLGKNPKLPEPSSSIIPTVSIAKASQWPDGVMPKVIDSFMISLYSKELTHPRWLYVLPNGDVLVSQSNKQPPKKTQGLKDLVSKYFMNLAGAGKDSPDKITLLRDSNDDGAAELANDFLTHLHSPFGMTLIGNDLYVANTDAILRFHYEAGDIKIDTKKHPPEKIVDLPEGEINSHWTKNIIASLDGTKLYVTVGSNSNIGERGLDQEKDRAAIIEIDLKTKQKRIYASGLRNPNGLAWHPSLGQLWTVVNERDELGNDLVPDYLTSVNDGDFFGWPYVYFKNYKDPRVKESMPKNLKPRSPDYALGAHVAALGLVFSNTSQFKSPYNNGVFISEHGSWNRKPRSGYKVVFIPFENNEPQGLPIDIVTNFVVGDEAYGRPVGLAIDKKGNLLVADDVGNRVWRITSK
ncbi:COG2133 Glucose/sorbosone dehydrogenases [Candidatus Methylopumilus planktonicus]|jgi:glucose/arabinose dehydrogenase|uniref:PQQ-dependent sugar dehydrogenase n=1 Tax=Candidatus Methylopumilus planktonicus TaxID=1581557 RepID=UPI003BEF354C